MTQLRELTLYNTKVSRRCKEAPSTVAILYDRANAGKRPCRLSSLIAFAPHPRPQRFSSRPAKPLAISEFMVVLSAPWFLKATGVHGKTRMARFRGGDIQA